LLVVVIISLFWIGYQVAFMLLDLANAALDWPSLALILWNFVGVGVTAIFWKGPTQLKKSYLVFFSSMMAFSLSQLPVLVTWILLGFLAVWDLIAVLCPYGPLRIMIESAQRQNVDIPDALIYSAMVWMMATPGSPPKDQPPVLELDTSAISPFDIEFVDKKSPILVTVNTSVGVENETHSADYRNNESQAQQSIHGSTAELMDAQPQRSPIEMQTLGQREGPQATEEEDEEASGLKLGLGDFVFYSVLVGRASLYDWITTIGCILAVITGLVLTILLLVIKRKPLPALPISIVLGILIFLVSTQTLSPMIESLMGNRPLSPLLRAGSQGAGFIFL
jgi:presenilin 1